MATFLFLFLLAALLPVQLIDGCTVFAVGKKATKDGKSVLVSHSDDGEFTTDPRLVKIPAADWFEEKEEEEEDDEGNENRAGAGGILRPIYFSPEDYPRYVGYATDRGRIPEYHPNKEDTANQQVPFVPIGYIPQVSHTYAYIEQTYGAINEHHVGIGESTCSGVFGSIPLGHPNGTALLSIDQLSQIAMERSQSAREAILIMGEHAERYGFYGAGSFEGTSEALAVSDPNEVWIFHILPDPTGTSAIWAAQRVPDDHFAVIANMFVIREVDPHDPQHFLMSDSVHDVAIQMGWYDPNNKNQELLDFTAVYSDGEYAHKFYSGRRVWGSYHVVSPSLNLPSNYTNLLSDKVYPVSAIPDTKLDVHDLFALHRYAYEGTSFDLGKPGNLAAGPFGSPDRWKGGQMEAQIGGAWERPIGLYRTTNTHVVQSRTCDCASCCVGGVLWFGPSSALGTVFTPFVVSMSDIPTSFRSSKQQLFDRSSMFWAAVYAHNIANLKWNYAIEDIRQLQSMLETNSTIHILPKLDQILYLDVAAKIVDDDDDNDDSDRNNNNMRKTNTIPTTADSDISRIASNITAVSNSKIESILIKNAEYILEQLWKLSDLIMFKYADGFVNNGPGDMSNVVGYPKWWLEAVGYQNGPPPVPPRPEHNDKRDKANEPIPPKIDATGKMVMKAYLNQKGEQQKQ